MKKPVVVGLTLAIAVAAFGIGTATWVGRDRAGKEVAAQTNADALSRANAPAYGHPSARVTITEFLDPACEACRAFHPIVKRLVDSSFGQVKVRVRYAPLHDGSEEAVRLLEAARRQDRFWPVLEALYEGQSIWASHGKPDPAAIWSLLDDTGLDLDKARKDARASEVDAVLAKEKADLVALRIAQTPTFFVNGKPLTDFGEQPLRALVASELGATAN